MEADGTGRDRTLPDPTGRYGTARDWTGPDQKKEKKITGGAARRRRLVRYGPDGAVWDGTARRHTVLDGTVRVRTVRYGMEPDGAVCNGAVCNGVERRYGTERHGLVMGRTVTDGLGSDGTVGSWERRAVWDRTVRHGIGQGGEVWDGTKRTGRYNMVSGRAVPWYGEGPDGKRADGMVWGQTARCGTGPQGTVEY